MKITLEIPDEFASLMTNIICDAMMTNAALFWRQERKAKTDTARGIHADRLAAANDIMRQINDAMEKKEAV